MLSARSDIAAQADDPAASEPWPLVGQPLFATVDAAWRATLADRLEDDLRRHVVEAWFPHCVDRRAGGFLCNFDRRWRPRGAQPRMLEFQARQTLTAARLGIAYPSEPTWPELALHGLRFMHDVMRDREHGGFFWLLDRDHAPAHAGTKHAHSTAYLLWSAANVHRLTGEPIALQVALDAFEWLERSVHDDDYGGYLGWATREGQPIRNVAEVDPSGRLREPLGQQAGVKDTNVHADLLAGFSALVEVRRDAQLERRLAEVQDILVGRFHMRHGAIHYMAYADWTPVPTLQRYGYHFQTPPRLVHAAGLLGRSHEPMLELARACADHAQATARAPRGGFVYAGPAAPPRTIAATSLVVRERSWWVHAGALSALLLLGLSLPDGERYRREAEALADVVERDFLDLRHGRWYAVPPIDRPLHRRWRRSTYRKSGPWKEASHEADAYLTGVRMLRGLPRDAPLG